MKNLFLTKTRWLVTIILLTALGSGNVWGEEITYTFSSKAWAASPANWTSNKDGSSFESSGSARGVANNGVNGACTSPITFANVSSISIVASSNTTGGKVAIKIGDTQIANKSIAKKTNATYTYNSDDYQSIANLSGNVQIVVTKPNSKSVWVKSITITYSAETPTLTCATTSLSFEAAVDGTDTKNFTFSGSNLTANASLAISGTNAAMFSVTPTSVNKGSGTITDQSVTVTYSPTAAGTHSATLTISSTDATDKTITLSGTATLSHNVYYYNNGTLVHTGTVADGGDTDALWDGLDDNAACDDVTYKYFAGWSKTNFGSTPISNPTLNEAYTSVSDDVSYYAVWSDTDPSSGSWEVATSIAAGDVVVLCNQACTYELNGISTTSTTYGILASVENKTPANLYPLTIEAGASDGTFSFKNGTKYLSWSSGNSLASSTTKNKNSSWTVSISNGVATIRNSIDASRYLQYNAGSRFACYANTQADVALYKQGSSGTPVYITTCCTPLGTINGSISWSSTSATLTWDNIANVSGWAVTCKNTSTSAAAGSVGSITTNGAGKKTCTITDLTCGGTGYTFTISATAASGYCDNSWELTGSTTACTDPAITVSPTSLTGLDYIVGSGPSASQSFTISGSNLGADLVVTAPENYEVCKTADGTYTSTISYTPSDGAVANTTAYIRLAAGLNVGTYNYAAASGLQVTSTGAKTRTAALNGSVTKADCAITFTDFNAVDHYEATLEYGSRVTVSYNYTYNGDGNFSISRSPGTGTIDNANKTLTVSTAGIWTLNASATAGTNYSKPSDASALIRVKCVDTYKDFIHNKTIKAYGSGTVVTDGKMEDWGSGYTVPYIEDNAEETSGSCQQTHYKFMGWVSEDDINIADGTFKTGWTLIQAGTESKLATTKTYYAVWAKLEE